MTLIFLNEHLKLIRELEQVEAMLSSLRAHAESTPQTLTGAPHGSGAHDKVGSLSAEIVDLDKRAGQLREKINRQQRSKVEPFVRSIRQDQTRLIFRLRFVRGLSWRKVAELVGGGNTKESVKSICYRYIKNLHRDDAP